MKYFLFIFTFLFSITTYSLDISIDYASFSDLEKPYIEVYFSAVGKTLEIKDDGNNLFHSKVNVLLTIEKDGQIILADKFNMVGPQNGSYIDFVEQRRYSIDNGNYVMKLQFKDIYDETNHSEIEKKIEVDFPSNEAKISGIQMLYDYKASENEDNSITKNGYELKPLPFNFLARGERLIKFYTEVYNVDKLDDGMALFRYYIYDEYNKTIHSIGNKKIKNKNVEVYILSMDISTLASGNYSLITELRNTKNEIIDTHKSEFQRSNPFYKIPEESVTETFLEKQFVYTLDNEQLKRSLLCLIPRMDSEQVKTVENLVDKNSDLEMKRYLFSYYVGIDPNLPEIAFIKYMANVAYTDKNFRTDYRVGYNTDRGYLFLKYGPPNNSITIDDEDVLPYEIWLYDKLAGKSESNVKYLFYNETFTSNDFVLLHSTEKGNVSNPDWFKFLSGSKTRTPLGQRGKSNSVRTENPYKNNTPGSSIESAFGRRGQSRALQYWDEI